MADISKRGNGAPKTNSPEQDYDKTGVTYSDGLYGIPYAADSEYGAV